MQETIRTFSKDIQLVRARREHIAECAAKVLVKKGYDRTSIREIAEACGMALGTLYHYVGSKQDILYLVINHGLSRYADFFDQIVVSLDAMSPTEALKHAIQEFYRRLDGFQDFTVFTYQETKNLHSSARQSVFDAERRLVAAFEKILERGCMGGEFEVDNVTLVAHDIVVAAEMWAVKRWFVRKYATLDEYTGQHIKSFLKSISPNSPTSSSRGGTS